MSQFYHQIKIVDQCLYITVSGTAKAHDILIGFREAFLWAKPHQCHQMLIDASQLEVDFQSIEMFSLIAILKQQLSCFEIGCVINHQLHKHSMIREIAIKENLTFSNFDSVAKAKAWLSELTVKNSIVA